MVSKSGGNQYHVAAFDVCPEQGIQCAALEFKHAAVRVATAARSTTSMTLARDLVAVIRYRTFTRAPAQVRAKVMLVVERAAGSQPVPLQLEIPGRRIEYLFRAYSNARYVILGYPPDLLTMVI